MVLGNRIREKDGPIRREKIRYDMIRYDTTRYHTTRYDTTRYDNIPYGTIPHKTRGTRYGGIKYEAPQAKELKPQALAPTERGEERGDYILTSLECTNGVLSAFMHCAMSSRFWPYFGPELRPHWEITTVLYFR